MTLPIYKTNENDKSATFAEKKSAFLDVTKQQRLYRKFFIWTSFFQDAPNILIRPEFA